MVISHTIKNDWQILKGYRRFEQSTENIFLKIEETSFPMLKNKVFRQNIVNKHLYFLCILLKKAFAEWLV